ncbi:MAG: S-layer homology domain-containing protein [Firmicutes bacterium]|nr:S-layer homology domain-containing protein [Bacillota bacterium]
MKTKALAVFLTLVMIVGLMPAAVFAEDPVEGVECIGECTNEAHVAAIGNAHYTSIQAAVAAAKDGEEIKIIRDHEMDCNTVVSNSGGYSSLVNVAEKSVIIDLNGKEITAKPNAAQFENAKSEMLLGVFAVDTNGVLTLKDSSKTERGSVSIIANDANVYSLAVCYGVDGKLNIESGSYSLDYSTNGLIYSQHNEVVTINGGTFCMGNVGTLSNGSPWIFCAKGQNTQHVFVNGGTFNADILHQYYPFEVSAPKENALKKEYNDTFGCDMWTMVPAVAYVNEQEWSSRWYTNEVGYASLEEAISAVDPVKTKVDNKVSYNSNEEYVTMLTDATIESDIELTIPVKIYGQGKTVTAAKDIKIEIGENGEPDSRVILMGDLEIKADSPHTLTAYMEGAITAGEGAVLTLGENLCIKNSGEITPVCADGGKVEVNGAKVISENNAAALKAKGEGSIVTVDKGRIKGKLEEIEGGSIELLLNGGCFDRDPSDLCDDGMTGVESTEDDSDEYPWTVGVKGDDPVTDAKLTINVEQVVGDGKDYIEELADYLEGTGVPDPLKIESEKLNAHIATIANDNEIIPETEIEGNTVLGIYNSMLDTDITANELNIVVQPFIEVRIIGYGETTDEEGNTIVSDIDLEITPMVRTIATSLTDEQIAEGAEIEIAETQGSEGNSIQIGEEEPIEIEGRFPIKFYIPDGLADENGSLYIKHIHDDNEYIYKAEITQNPNGAEYDKVRFINPKGFSEFTLMFDFVPVAKIGEYYYDELAGAVEAVENNETITLLSDNSETIEVGRTVTFTFDTNGKEFTGAIEAGENTTLEKVEAVYSFTYSEPPRKPSKPKDETCDGGEGCSCNEFSDLDPEKWYHEAVDYVIEKGIMKGVGEDEFDPDGELTRAMMWTMLARQDGVDTTGEGVWYASALEWAKDKGITDGTGANKDITREQMVTMLYRYAQYKGHDVSVGEDTNILSFEDALEISEWAMPAMQWACGAGVIDGDGSKLDPLGIATRAEIAQIFYNYFGK